MESIRILLVEDDQDLGNVLSQYLIMNNFEVELCRDGKEGLAAFKATSFHLCILDVMLPEMDGFKLAQKITKANQDVPFIFLTAKSLKTDKLKGLRLGADDYMTKPFEPEELLLRIGNILRRWGKPHSEIYEIGEYQFYFKKYKLVLGSTEQALTAREAELLKLLVENENKVLKRNDILKALWGDDDFFLGRSMDVFITRLRKYLSQDKNIMIQTVRGVGIMIEVKP